MSDPYIEMPLQIFYWYFDFTNAFSFKKRPKSILFMKEKLLVEFSLLISRHVFIYFTINLNVTESKKLNTETCFYHIIFGMLTLVFGMFLLDFK